MLSRRSVEISNFHLTDTVDKLHVSVRNVAVFHLPSDLTNHSDEQILESMYNGKPYVTRGPHCRLVIAMYHDGKLMEDMHWQDLYEKVKERVEHAPVGGVVDGV